MGNDPHQPVFAWTAGGFTVDLRGLLTGRHRTPLVYRFRDDVWAGAGAPVLVSAGDDLSGCTWYVAPDCRRRPPEPRRSSGHQLTCRDVCAADLGECLTPETRAVLAFPLEVPQTTVPVTGAPSGRLRV